MFSSHFIFTPEPGLPPHALLRSKLNSPAFSPTSFLKKSCAPMAFSPCTSHIRLCWPPWSWLIWNGFFPSPGSTHFPGLKRRHTMIWSSSHSSTPIRRNWPLLLLSFYGSVFTYALAVSWNQNEFCACFFRPSRDWGFCSPWFPQDLAHDSY